MRECFRSSTHLMSSTIKHFRTLNENDVIPGDIHPGNVLQVHPNSWEVRLIDFGSSLFVDELAKFMLLPPLLLLALECPRIQVLI
jgi:serine/threonine protein kinase